MAVFVGVIVIALVIAYVIWMSAIFIPWACEHDGESFLQAIRKRKMEK